MFPIVYIVSIVSIVSVVNFSASIAFVIILFFVSNGYKIVSKSFQVVPGLDFRVLFRLSRFRYFEIYVPYL